MKFISKRSALNMLAPETQWDFYGIDSNKFFNRIIIDYARPTHISYICEDFKTDPITKRITHLTGAKFQVGNGFLNVYRDGFEPIKLVKVA